MIRETVTPLVLATLVVLAGCVGAISNAPTGGAAATADTGTVNFYISDERNAIDDFEHLNVTITAVGFKKADTDDEETETTTPTTTTNTTTTTTTATTETTTTQTTTETTTTETEEESEESEIEDKNESDDWVVRQVDNVTIDLTEYQGANATLLEQFEIPNGTYTKTFVYVSSVNATLTNGEQVNVKLPSEKLHINKQFTVGNNESVDFVFDITVFKAGNSGFYILKPVMSQSGTDVPIDAENEADEEDGANGEQGPPEDVGPANEEESALNASFNGSVTPGETVEIVVTKNGSAVAEAQVFADDRRLGETDANGTLTVEVPHNVEEFEVTVRYQDMETELEVEFATEETTTTTTS